MAQLRIQRDSLPTDFPVIYAGDFNPPIYDFDASLGATGAMPMNNPQIPTYFRGPASSTPGRVLLCQHPSWGPAPGQDAESEVDAAECLSRAYPATALGPLCVSGHAAAR